MSWVLIQAIRFYQRFLSRFIRTSCLYTPTCSEYAVGAIRRYGPHNGLKMAIERLLRCRHPYEGGHDPVEQKGQQPPAFYVASRRK